MPSAIELDSVIVITKDQVSCELAGETAILQTESGLYYGLNALGTRIWEIIQTPKRVFEIRDTLMKEYEVEKDLCESELFGLLEDLEDANLIVKGESTGFTGT